MPRFIRRHDNGNIEIFAFSGTAVVGRSRRAQVVIDDVSVSATHARIESTPDGYLLNDLDSRNGTKINNAEVKTGKLRPGDQVKFGKILVTYEADEGEAPAAAAAPVAPAAPPVETRPSKPPVVPEPRTADMREAAAGVADAKPAPPPPPPPPAPVPAPAPVAPPRSADAGAAREGDIKLRVLKDQVRALQKQRVMLAGLCCGLALLTVIFLIAFLIKRTAALEMEHKLKAREEQNEK